MTRSFRSLSAEVGARRAEIFREIRRCLRLRGGRIVSGVKWIWKTAVELAELLGVDEKTIRRDLAYLCEIGWLQREQLQKRWGMRTYHYCLGPDAPLKEPKTQPVQCGQVTRTEAGTMPGSNNSSTYQKNPPPPPNSPTAQQPRTETVVYAAVRGVSGRQEAPVAVPEHWPEPSGVKETLLALENIRNSIPWLTRKPKGFGAVTA